MCARLYTADVRAGSDPARKAKPSDETHFDRSHLPLEVRITIIYIDQYPISNATQIQEKDEGFPVAHAPIAHPLNPGPRTVF